MKRVLSGILLLALLVVVCGGTAAEHGQDTSGGAVEYCVEKGILRQEEYQQGALLSRIEWMVMLSRALGFYDDADQAFYEVKYEHFNALASNGLLQPEVFPVEEWAQPVNRFEVAQLSAQALTGPLDYIDSGDERYIDSAADRNAIPQLYCGAVNLVYQAGIMDSMGGGLAFDGWQAVTKEEGCQVIWRLLEEQARSIPTVGEDYRVLLGRYTTSYDDGEEPDEYRLNSIFNLVKAALTLDGVEIGPGQVFSFNRYIGNAGRAEGYLKGIIVSGGRKVPGYGGGICQAATTLFDAALYANMEIVERHNHGLKSTYVPPGTDSAIYYGTLDLRFRNPYSCTVRIVFDHDPDEKTITAKLYGTEGTIVPPVELELGEENGKYTLTRWADGTANYTCTSRYRD